MAGDFGSALPVGSAGGANFGAATSGSAPSVGSASGGGGGGKSGLVLTGRGDGSACGGAPAAGAFGATAHDLGTSGITGVFCFGAAFGGTRRGWPLDLVFGPLMSGRANALPLALALLRQNCVAFDGGLLRALALAHTGDGGRGWPGGTPSTASSITASSISVEGTLVPPEPPTLPSAGVLETIS